jgi:hypothetical protein
MQRFASQARQAPSPNPAHAQPLPQFLSSTWLIRGFEFAPFQEHQNKTLGMLEQKTSNVGPRSHVEEVSWLDMKQTRRSDAGVSFQKLAQKMKLTLEPEPFHKLDTARGCCDWNNLVAEGNQSSNIAQAYRVCSGYYSELFHECSGLFRTFTF